MRYELLLFDLDGTLVDSHHEICLALACASRELTLDLSVEQLSALVDGSPLEHVWAQILRERPDCSHAYGHFASTYRKHYMHDIGHATSVFPDVEATLSRIRDHPSEPACAVVSNKAHVSVAPLLAKLGLSEFFDLALGSGESAFLPKPAPDLLLEAARQLGVQPARCVMIGDTSLDVLAGKRAGMTTIAVTHGMESLASLRALGADYLVEDFAALSKALFES